jgi:hypothetical protein
MANWQIPWKTIISSTTKGKAGEVMPRRSLRLWGLAFCSVGTLFLCSLALGDSPVNTLTVIAALLIGQLLPVPPALDQWFTRLRVIPRVIVRLALFTAGILLFALLIAALVAVSGLSVSVASIAAFFVVGGGLLVISGMSP